MHVSGVGSEGVEDIFRLVKAAAALRSLTGSPCPCSTAAYDGGGASSLLFLSEVVYWRLYFSLGNSFPDFGGESIPLLPSTIVSTASALRIQVYTRVLISDSIKHRLVRVSSFFNV